MFHLNKEKIIKYFKERVLENLGDLEDRFKDDKEVVLEAVKVHGLNLVHASERLRDDKDIVLTAVKNYSKVIYKASERLQNDIDIMSEVIKKNKFILLKCSKELQENKILLEILEDTDISNWFGEYKSWYQERMEVLSNIREKELMEKAIKSNINMPKKLKF